MSTFLEKTSLSSAEVHAWHPNRQPLSFNERQVDGSIKLLLSFLALTMRHCGGEWEYFLSSNRRGWESSIESSAHYAMLAESVLRNNFADNYVSSIEEVQARLMLASYQWSLCCYSKARSMLRDAVSIAQDLEIGNESIGKSTAKPMSVAMAFEAELMGLPSRAEILKQNRLRSKLVTEISQRTFWSCYLLDVQFSLGEGRASFLNNTYALPPMPSDENEFIFISHLADPEDDKSAVRRCEAMSRSRNVSMENVDPFLRTVSGPAAAILAPLIRSESMGALSGSQIFLSGTPLAWYIRSLSLLACINTWNYAGKRRLVLVYQLWTLLTDV